MQDGFYVGILVVLVVSRNVLVTNMRGLCTVTLKALVTRGSKPHCVGTMSGDVKADRVSMILWSAIGVVGATWRGVSISRVGGRRSSMMEMRPTNRTGSWRANPRWTISSLVFFAASI